MKTAFRNTHESKLIRLLSQITDYLCESGIVYGIFGSCGIAGYIGHFPRKIHDVDIVLKPDDMRQVKDVLESLGFSKEENQKNISANFENFVYLKDGVWKPKVSLFPGKYTFVDVDDPTFKPLGTYDFTKSLEKRQFKQIYSIDHKQNVDVYVLPLEELIISKLWPVFETVNVHDLFLLLSNPDSENIDVNYILSRIKNSPEYTEMYLTNLDLFKKYYPKTAWHSDSCLEQRIHNQLICLEEVRYKLEDKSPHFHSFI